MGVQVRHRGHDGSRGALQAGPIGIRLDGRDRAVVTDREDDIPRPACGQQRMVCGKFQHAGLLRFLAQSLT